MIIVKIKRVKRESEECAKLGFRERVQLPQMTIERESSKDRMGKREKSEKWCSVREEEAVLTKKLKCN